MLAGSNPAATAQRLGLSAPLFDRLWDHDLAVRGLWKASAGVAMAGGRLGMAVASGLLRQAGEQVADTGRSVAQNGMRQAQPQGPRALADAGVTLVDRSLRGLQADDAVLEAMRDLLDAGSRLRSAQVDLLDRWARALGQPTRREVDDLARELTELRRHLRARQGADDEAVLQAELAGEDRA